MKALILLLLCTFYLTRANAQTQQFSFDSTDGSWKVVKGNAVTVASPSHEGKALQLSSGTVVSIPMKLKAESSYKVTAWLRTASGETSVTLKSNGLGQEFSITSAKPNWTKVEKVFNVGKSIKSASLELVFDGNSEAWADDITVERHGDYHAKTMTGFLPKSQRILTIDFGVTQQSDEKMQWMHDARIGMFIHWGLYAGPAKGEWYMENNGVQPDAYRKLAYPDSDDEYFDASQYNPDEWMRVAKAMGARYTVLTTMHHDGYALFDSHYMDAFSSKQTLNRDLVREYVEACHKADMRVGFYKTLINWRYPGYYDITGKDCKTNKFGYTTAAWHKENARLMKEGLYSDIRTLMTEYGKIDMLFWDGGWIGQQGSDRDAAAFWESYKYVTNDNPWKVDNYFLDKDSVTGSYLGLIGMIRKYQPDILMNPRSGWIGDYTCDEGSAPVLGEIRQTLQEKCITLGPGWGYTHKMENADNIIGVEKLQRYLADCVTRNVNLLVNVGPDRHGHIPDAEASVLTKFGDWVCTVSEAVYGTTAGPWQPVDNQYGFTCKDNKIYVWLLNGFKGDSLTLPAVSKGYKVRSAYVLDSKTEVRVSQKNRKITFKIAPNHNSPTVIVMELNKKVY